MYHPNVSFNRKSRFTVFLLTLAALIAFMPTISSLGQTPVVSQAQNYCSDLVNPLFAHVKTTTAQKIAALDTEMTWHHKATGDGDTGLDGTVIVARGELEYITSGPPRVEGVLTAKYIEGIGANIKSNTFKVSILAVSGNTSIQRQIDGKNFLGRGPLAFSPNCAKDLMTTIVNGEIYTFSFRKTTHPVIN